MAKLKAFILIVTLFSSTVFAEQCDINFQYGVIMTPEQVRFLKHDKTYVQINNQEQLFINGREVELSHEQKQLIAEYTEGIQAIVPQLVSIAIDSVDIGLKAVNKVVGGLTGENSESHQKVQKQFEEMQWRLRKRFNHSDNSYYVAPQDFDDFDQLFAGEFEKELEQIITTSLGSILMAVGEAMANRDEGSSESRANTFDDRIEALADDLEVEITTRAQEIETKASEFCKELQTLNTLESEIKTTIPQLTDFNLIELINN